MHRYDAHHKFTIRSVDFTDQGFYTCEIVQSLYYVKNATMIFKLTVLGRKCTPLERTVNRDALEEILDCIIRLCSVLQDFTSAIE